MRTRISHTSIFVAALAFIAGSGVFGAQSRPADSAKPPGSRPADPPAAPATARPLTVAILDFGAKDPATPDLGAQIGEVLTAVLSGEPGFTLVDRATLARTLQEHELNLTGAVSTEQAVQVGKLVGARILVTGRAFALGKQVFITAKLIGTETSLVEGVLVKDENGGDVGKLVVSLATEIADRLRKAGPRLVASEDAVDPLPRLKKELAGVRKPKVAVIITEEHMRPVAARPPVDPAVETEVKLLLRECGFEIMDVPQNELADWARMIRKEDVESWPRGLRDVDVVITGEAFSEFAARIGNLVSCSARAEVNLISRKDGKIILAQRETTRAVDLSENIAGKKALEKAGRVIGIRILEFFLKTSDTQPSPPTAVQNPGSFR
jgi:TolB-like protein